MKTLRILARVIVGILASLLVLAGAALGGANAAVGSADSVAGIVQSTLSDPRATYAVSERLIEQVLKDADPRMMSRLTAEKGRLIKAAQTAVASESDQLSEAARQIYQALQTREIANVDLSSLFNALSKGLHEVDRAIPVDALKSADTNVSFDGAKQAQVFETVSSVLRWRWPVVGLAVLCLACLGFLGQRRGPRRLRAPALVVTCTSLVWIAALLIVSNRLMAQIGNDAALVQSLIPHVVAPLRTSAVVILGLGLIAFAASFLRKFPWAHRSAVESVSLPTQGAALSEQPEQSQQSSV